MEPMLNNVPADIYLLKDKKNKQINGYGAGGVP